MKVYYHFESVLSHFIRYYIDCKLTSELTSEAGSISHGDYMNIFLKLIFTRFVNYEFLSMN